MLNRIKIFILWIMFWVLQLIRGQPIKQIRYKPMMDSIGYNKRKRVKKNIDPYGKRYYNNKRITKDANKGNANE